MVIQGKYPLYWYFNHFARLTNFHIVTQL